jgi:Zn-dependent protease with chaperone function
LSNAEAERKREAASAATVSIKRGSAHLCIVYSLGRKMNATEGAAANLFASHPHIVNRIERLRKMAY